MMAGTCIMIHDQKKSGGNNGINICVSNVILRHKKSKNYLIFLFSFLAFLLSISQIFGNSPDYSEYADFFDLARKEGSDVLEQRFEQGFSIFVFMLSFFISSNIIVYSIFVAVAAWMKGWVIDAYSLSAKVFIVAALFYLVRYFPLHDLTQLRAACAITLMLVGSVFLWRGQLLFGIFICASALAFHYSSAAVIPALFLQTNKRWLVVSIGGAVFAATSIFSGLITGYLSSFIVMLDSYRNNGFGEFTPNPFAIQLLIDWAIILVSFIVWEKLSTIMKRVVLLELIGMGIFYGGIDFAIIAHRVREFYSVFWLLYVIEGVQQKSTRLLTYSFITISVTFYSYVFFLSGDFFH